MQFRYTSSHPEHTKKSVVYSQALRLSQICSQEKDLKKHICEMKSWFSQRGYPQKLIVKLGKLNFLVKEFSIAQRLRKALH